MGNVTEGGVNNHVSLFVAVSTFVLLFLLLLVSSSTVAIFALYTDVFYSSVQTF